MSVRLIRSLVRNARTFTKPGSSSSHRYRFRTIVLACSAGYIGGIASICAAGYGFYYIAGVKKLVDTLSPAMILLDKASNALIDDKPSPNAALQYLRQAAKAYLAYIPGSGLLIDAMFNRIDKVVDKHSEETNGIVTKAYIDIANIISHDGNRHETHTALEILAVCKRLTEDLGALGVKAIKPHVDALELDKKAQTIAEAVGQVVETVKEKSPELKAEADRRTKPIGTAVGNILETVKTRSPDWKRSIDEFTSKAASQVTTAKWDRDRSQNQEKSISQEREETK